MSITPGQINSLVEAELKTVSDRRVIEHIESLLVQPQPILRQWDYGEPNDKFICWPVLDHEDSNTGIAYSEFGFGPTYPWGLVQLSGSENDKSIGMDCGWFPSFIEAYFESFASSDLPIWKVFKDIKPITEESSWDSTWEKVYEMRNNDSASHYRCDHSIEYQKSDI